MDSDSKIIVMPVQEEPAGEQPADSAPQATGGGGAGGNGGDKGLTPQQRHAIELLAEGKKKIEVAEKLGIDRSTVHRWLQDSAFRAAYDRAVEEFLDDARAAARSNLPLAMETLKEVMEEYPRASGAVSAARAILRMHGLL